MEHMQESPANQIDQASAEAFIAEKHIGERIKRLRLKRSMGLVELGRQTGLSASFLSQLETGRVVPTLRNLARIALVFGKDLSCFFENEPHALFRIHRKKSGFACRKPAWTIQPITSRAWVTWFRIDIWIRTTQSSCRSRKILKSARTSTPAMSSSMSSRGSWRFGMRNARTFLEQGDGVYFDASTPHSYTCAGKGSAIALIVTMHQQTAPQPVMSVRPAALAAAKAIPSSGTLPSSRPGPKMVSAPSHPSASAPAAVKERSQPIR